MFNLQKWIILAFGIGVMFIMCNLKVTSAQEKKSLLVNPGFEDELESWKVEYGKPEIDEEIFHSGKKSLKLSSNCGVYSDFFPYHGEKIALSCWLKTKDVVVGAKPYYKVGVNIVPYDENQKPAQPTPSHKSLMLIDGTTDWQEYKHIFIFHSGVAYIRIQCVYWSAASGEAWFDDLKLEYLTEETPAPAKKAEVIDREKATVTVDANKIQGDLSRIWDAVDNSYVTRIFMPEHKDLFPLFSSAGFKYVRVHETLVGPRVYQEDTAGNPVYNWTYLDSGVDILVKNGFKVYFSLETMPTAFAKEDLKKGYTNPVPPRDYKKWRDLVYQVVKHLQERYGAKEIENWYFGVWNEPDASGYFRGTQEEYFKVYDYAVDGATSANPNIKIGGPEGAGLSWMEDFIRHCAEGINAVTGKKGTRVDFFSWHIYTASPEIIQENFATVRKSLSNYPQFSKKPLIIGEYGSNSGTGEYMDTNYNASYVIKAIKVFADCSAEKVFCFNTFDHPWGKDNKIDFRFKGHHGLLTTAGVPKASYNAFLLLNKLESKRLSLENNNSLIDGLASLSSDKKKLVVILTNYHFNPQENYQTKVSLLIKNFGMANANYKRYLIDKDHSNPYTKWRDDMGGSEPSAGQIAILKEAGKLTVVDEKEISIGEEDLKLEINLSSHSVSLIEITKK